MLKNFGGSNLYFKKNIIFASIICATFLMGCGSSGTNKVSVENISLSIPDEYQTISASSLDNAQIVHNIIGARKSTDGNIILASSTLPAQVSLKEFAEKTKTRISQAMIGYANSSISTKKFSCDGNKKIGYLHSFDKVEIKDNAKILLSYNQFYFVEGNSLYILSLAQSVKKPIVQKIIDSIECGTATEKD